MSGRRMIFSLVIQDAGNDANTRNIASWYTAKCPNVSIIMWRYNGHTQRENIFCAASWTRNIWVASEENILLVLLGKYFITCYANKVWPSTRLILKADNWRAVHCSVGFKTGRWSILAYFITFQPNVKSYKTYNRQQWLGQPPTNNQTAAVVKAKVRVL